MKLSKCEYASPEILIPFDHCRLLPNLSTSVRRGNYSNTGLGLFYRNSMLMSHPQSGSHIWTCLVGRTCHLFILFFFFFHEAAQVSKTSCNLNKNTNSRLKTKTSMCMQTTCRFRAITRFEIITKRGIMARFTNVLL